MKPRGRDDSQKDEHVSQDSAINITMRRGKKAQSLGPCLRDSQQDVFSHHCVISHVYGRISSWVSVKRNLWLKPIRMNWLCLRQ